MSGPYHPAERPVFVTIKPGRVFEKRMLMTPRTPRPLLDIGQKHGVCKDCGGPAYRGGPYDPPAARCIPCAEEFTRSVEAVHRILPP